MATPAAAFSSYLHSSPPQLSLSCQSSLLPLQVRCGCSDPVPRCRSLNVVRRKFSVDFAVSSAALLLLQLTEFSKLARADVVKLTDGFEVDTNVLNRLDAFVDPKEFTQAGRTLPRSYLQSAKEVVRTLRESLKDDVQEELGYRVITEPAKEAIRVYLNSWMSSKELAAEDSFQALSKTLRDLGQFYIDAGPMASLPGDVKATLLEDLDKADAAL